MQSILNFARHRRERDDAEMREIDNITLLGMPAAGKSTIGVMLAKKLLMHFVDTDVVIQERERQSLEEIIRERGLQGFCRLEGEVISSLNCRNTVIAPGGSIVYSPSAMKHLKTRSAVVLLIQPLSVLKERLGDMDQRGVVRQPGQTVESLYHERMPLYREAADCIIRCRKATPERIIEHIVEAVDSVPRPSLSSVKEKP